MVNPKHLRYSFLKTLSAEDKYAFIEDLMVRIHQLGYKVVGFRPPKTEEMIVALKAGEAYLTKAVMDYPADSPFLIVRTNEKVRRSKDNQRRGSQASRQPEAEASHSS